MAQILDETGNPILDETSDPILDETPTGSLFWWSRYGVIAVLAMVGALVL